MLIPSKAGPRTRRWWLTASRSPRTSRSAESEIRKSLVMWVLKWSVMTGFAGSLVSMTATPWSSKDPRYATCREASAATFEYWPADQGASDPTSDMERLSAWEVLGNGFRRI